MEDLNFTYKINGIDVLDTIDIDSYQCVKNISVYIENKGTPIPTLDYKLSYDEIDWLKVIKQGSNIYLYVKDNFTNYERFFYLTIENYYTGSKDILTIKQEKCNFNIEIKDGIISRSLNEENIEIVLLVSGASKSCFINNEDIYIECNDDILTYDNSLFYTLTKNNENCTEKTDEYVLNIKYLGDFDGKKVFFYKIPITHSNNSEVNLILTLKVIQDYSLNANYIINNFNYEYQKQKQGETIREINMYNLESEFKEEVTQTQSDNGISTLSDDFIEQIDSLSIVDIEYHDNDTKVLLKAKTEPEFDSLIFIYPKAQWIKSKTVLSLETKLHEITIYCDKNYWKIQRKALVTLTNAENSDKTLTYLVTQESDNTIMIEKYIKD